MSKYTLINPYKKNTITIKNRSNVVALELTGIASFFFLQSLHPIN